MVLSSTWFLREEQGIIQNSSPPPLFIRDPRTFCCEVAQIWSSKYTSPYHLSFQSSALAFLWFLNKTTLPLPNLSQHWHLLTHAQHRFRMILWKNHFSTSSRNALLNLLQICIPKKVWDLSPYCPSLPPQWLSLFYPPFISHSSPLSLCSSHISLEFPITPSSLVPTKSPEVLLPRMSPALSVQNQLFSSSELPGHSRKMPPYSHSSSSPTFPYDSNLYIILPYGTISTVYK